MDGFVTWLLGDLMPSLAPEYLFVARIVMLVVVADVMSAVIQLACMFSKAVK